MDNQRLIIWATFGLLLWLTYQAWVQDHAPVPAAQGPTTSDQIVAPLDDAPGLPALPAESSGTPQLADDTPALDGVTADAPGQTAPIIHVKTDVLDVDISTVGGTLQRALLLKYPVHKDQPDVLIELLSPGAAELGMIQTGLNSAGDGPKANHTASFSAEATEYLLGNNDELIVPLTWTDGQGLTGRKNPPFYAGQLPDRHIATADQRQRC